MMMVTTTMIIMTTMSARAERHLPYTIGIAEHNGSPQLSIHAHEVRRQFPTRVISRSTQPN
jgi:hypothetical protein